MADERGPDQLPGIDARRVFTVANVTRGLARRIDELPTIWVAGDLAELNRNDRWATAYLTLKDPDEGSTLRVTIARWALDQVTPALDAGSHVLVYGRPSLYERTCELSLRARGSSGPATGPCSHGSRRCAGGSRPTACSTRRGSVRCPSGPAASA